MLKAIISAWKERPLSVICEVIETVTKLAPCLLTLEDKDVFPTALFTALNKKAPGTIVSTLLRLGARATITNRDGETPLHVALRCDAPREAVFAILRVYADAALNEDSVFCTPLHRFAASRRLTRKGATDITDNIDIAEALLAAAPAAVSMFNDDRQTPLSLAVRNMAPVDLVARILAAIPLSTLQAHLRETGVMDSSACKSNAALRSILEEAVVAAAKCVAHEDMTGTATLEGRFTTCETRSQHLLQLNTRGLLAMQAFSCEAVRLKRFKQFFLRNRHCKSRRRSHPTRYPPFLFANEFGLM